jgi:subtilisin family serine protease
MNHFYRQRLQLIFGAILLFSALLTQAQRKPFQKESAVSGKILVKLKTGTSLQVLKSLDRLSLNMRTESFSTGMNHFDAVARQLKATKMIRVFPNSGRMEIKQHKYGLDRWYELQVDPTVSIPAAVNSFRQVEEVETAQPAYVISSITSPITKITSGNTPSKPLDVTTPAVNDPYYYLQWHYHNTGQVGGYVGADINLEPAWKINAGKPNVIVDVVDEGVDYKHEDLAANMWVNLAELNGQPGVDDDGNGYVDDIHGYNFGDNTGTILPGDHGTHTSGTIAAVNNNGIGVAGIAGGTGNGDGARIMSSEIFGNNGADGAGTAAAIVYGANNGAVISQNSWGYTVPDVYDQVVLDAIDYFTKEAGRDANGNQTGPMNGGLVIFAAGNSNISDPSYPGYYPAAVAVGALSIYDNKASYSNFGDWVDISAPGGDEDLVGGTSKQMVASTVANNKYGYMAGTSMACPHVSGVAALIVSQYGKPGFTNEDLRNRLFHTADPFIAMNPGYNGLMGAGRLDAGKALEADKALPPVTINDLKGKSNTQNSIDLNWTAPSDPDNANAESYIVYYANHPFDVSQKDTLPKIFIKKALQAGSAETFNLSGLHSSTSYYISVTGKDLWGNESALSNILLIKTMDGPVTSVPKGPISMSINVKTSPLKSTTFKLSNNGLGILNWTAMAVPVSSSWAKPDGFNDTLRLVDQDYPDKFLGDDQRMDFSAATRFDVTKKAFNLTHVANYIQTAGVIAPIIIYVVKGGDDPSKGTLLLKQTMDQANDYSLNITKLNGMFLFQPGEWFWIVYQFDPAYGYGQGAENNATADQENYFLTSSNKGQTWKSIASQYEALRFFMYGLSNEGYPGGLVSLLPAGGTIPAMGSTNIAVNADASTIRNGVYNYNLIVNSNDLNNPSAAVPMVITVTGQKGTLMVKESILDCSTVFIGKDGDATIKLYNAGLSTLKKFTFTTDNNRFSNAALPDSLNPGDSTQFTVKFTPVAAGIQLAKLKISTNDGSVNLSASGVGVLPPVMTLKGTPVQIVAKVDSSGKNTFTISNKTGKYPLSYSMPEIAAINKAKLKGTLAKGTDPFTQYVWIDSQEPDGPVYNWSDISATGTDITQQLTADLKTSKAFQLGFPMNFYGDTISQVYVNSFGTLTLNYPGAMNSNNLYLPNPGDGISGLIAGLYLEEMHPVVRGHEHVFIKYAPGKFIVQYNDLEYFDGNFFDFGSYSLGKATFQIILYNNGKIEMNYKKASPNDPSNVIWSSYAQIGLENKAETKGINVNAYDLQPAPFIPADGVTLWFVPVAPKFITAVKPLSGAVAPGESVKIEVTASADGLVDSTYLSNISLTTNDPLNERVEVPVVFTVTGIKGMMQKTDTLAFGNVFKNASPKMEAVFLNTGSKAVQLLSTSISNAIFTTDQDTVTVPALSELHIPVTFKPTAETSYKGTLSLTTDDTAHKTFTVVLTGQGRSTPKITYSLTGGQTNTLNMGQTHPASIRITNNGDADLKIMLQRPQWLVMNQPDMGIGNGLDSANTYSLHKNIDSSAASYDWIELANGLGTSSIVDGSGLASEEIKLPFTFPYYGKNYHSLYVNWFGDVTLNSIKNVSLIFPTIPSPLPPNGIIASSNLPLVKAYDWDRLVYVGQIYYYADADKMVVEFYGMYEGEFGMNGKLTYETIFYKDGRIKMLYKSGEHESNFTQRMVVGIENEDGTDGTLAYNKSLWYKDRGVLEFVPSIPLTIKAGKSVEMPASWTTNSMTDGVYKDNLLISTNDPLNAHIKIPLELDVNGAMSVLTTDTVSFGKVVAYYSESDGAKKYTQPVLIKNNGSKTITVTGIDFNGNPSLTLDEYNQNPDLFASPLIMGPGDEQIYHVVFTPDSTLKTLNGRMNISSDYTSAISIPVTAKISLPPVISTDSTLLHFILQQNDSLSKNIKLINTGKGGLDYTLSVQYHRPGITYNSTVPVKPIKANPKSAVKSLYGNGQSTTILGNQTGTLGSGGHFADSILAFEPGRNNRDYLGTGYDETPITAATRFNGGKKGFYLSHVGDLYRTDNMIPTNIKFRIRLGSNITTSTVIYEQSVPIQPDTTSTGIYLIAKLDSAILINAYEDFWIEWNYAFGMRYPQGMQFIPSDHQKNHTFYTKVLEEYGWQELGLIADFYMAAYAQQDSSGGWLTITPDTGAVAANKKQQLKLVAHGPKVSGTDQSAELIIHSNDPVTPEAKVTVFVHIDQPPVLASHDTLTVQEADTLNALVPASDDGGGKVTVKLLQKDKLADVKNTDSGNYFIYRPGYDDAGVHSFGISMTDKKGNKSSDSLIVRVLNTNRAPVVVKKLANRTIAVNGPALNLPMVKVFMDPDGDLMHFSFAGEATPLAKIFVDADGVASVIPTDTGRVNLVFIANDSNGGITYDTLHLYIRNNIAPVATGIPDVVIDKGKSRTLDLSSYFSDADGDPLTYTATLDSVGSAALEISGTDLIINGLKPGISLVTVTAEDGAGGTVSKSFILFVLDSKGAVDDTYRLRVAPNPVRAYANIFFHLDRETNMKIELIGVNGVLRAIIYNGKRQAGYQNILYNFARFQTGTYTLKFTIGDDVRALQIIKL